MRGWCVCRGNLQWHFYKFVTPVSSAVDLHNEFSSHKIKCMQIIRTKEIVLLRKVQCSPRQPLYFNSCVWSSWRFSIYLSKLSRNKVRKDDLSIYLFYGLDAFETYYLKMSASSKFWKFQQLVYKNRARWVAKVDWCHFWTLYLWVRQLNREAYVVFSFTI